MANSTDGCTWHRVALKRPGRAVETGVQIANTRSRGQGELRKLRPRSRGELHKRPCRAQLGGQEAREVSTIGCTQPNLEPKRPGRAAQTAVQSPTWRPRGSKLSPRGVQEPQVNPKRRPRGSKLSPRGTQEASKMGPRGAQETPS